MKKGLTKLLLFRVDKNQKVFFNFICWVFSKWFKNLRYGHLTLVHPSGYNQQFEGREPGPTATIQIGDFRLIYRVIMAGDIGFAESYMAGEWKTPDLTAVLLFAAQNFIVLSKILAPLGVITKINRIRHLRRENTPKGSRRNIAAHYDLGNDFYRYWLDESMTYSSGLFESMGEPHIVAQRRKYQRLAQMLEIKEQDRVLEIGCGWGGFAEFIAARYGCEVVGVTLSNEQADFSRKRMVAAGLSDKVEIKVEDYRSIKGQFDKIVSIEMFEAVGEKNWTTYFEILKKRLKMGGRAGLQVITMSEEIASSYRKNPDFIQLFVFPGGMLPTPSSIVSNARLSELKISDTFYFGKSYAETLRLWNKAFQKNWTRIRRLNFDESFYRMWRYYLCYCEAGFEHGRINVGQFLLEHR
ncbi:MAG: SAM-dependent methyltransferase [Magnetovibrio sp.]|nr:SAM-dependent methyltransferase [Magnetovibrio sp.]